MFPLSIYQHQLFQTLQAEPVFPGFALGQVLGIRDRLSFVRTSSLRYYMKISKKELRFSLISLEKKLFSLTPKSSVYNCVLAKNLYKGSTRKLTRRSTGGRHAFYRVEVPLSGVRGDGVVGLLSIHPLTKEVMLREYGLMVYR